MKQEMGARSALTTGLEECPHLLSPCPRPTQAHAAKISNLLDPSLSLGFLGLGFDASAILEPRGTQEEGGPEHGPSDTWA